MSVSGSKTVTAGAQIPLGGTLGNDMMGDVNEKRMGIDTT